MPNNLYGSHPFNLNETHMTTLLSAGLLTAEHPNAVRVKRSEIAAGQGDISALRAVHAEAMVVHNSPLGGMQ